MPKYKGNRIFGAWLLFFMMSMAINAFAQDKVSGFYVFFKKPDPWSQVYIYTWYTQGTKLIEPTGRFPGKALADVAGWYRGFIDQSQTDPANLSINLIFSNAAGEQTPNLVRKENGWYVWKKQDQTVNAWFDLNPEEQLFTVATLNGEGSGQYTPGSLVKIQATVPPLFHFSAWKGADVGLLADPTRPFAQFSMPNRDVSFEAALEDLSSGQQSYMTLCAKCHGKEGEGGVGTNLEISSGKCKSCSSPETLAERISRTMPIGKVGQCVGDCARDVSRFILWGLNKADSIDCTNLSNRLGRRQLRLLTEREYRNSIRDILGLNEIAALRFWPESASVQGYNNNADSSIVSDRHLTVFVKAGQEISEKIRAGDVFKSSCGTDSRCAITQLGLQIYRRPLTTPEIDQYLKLWTTNAEGPQLVLRSMLQSPHFLYRSEMGTFISPINAYGLDAYEVASALSFTLVGSSPDAALLQAAADGSIKDASKRRSEAERLLQTDAARQSFGDFAVQWLGIGSLPFTTRDNKRLTASIRQDMLEETQRFLADLVFDQNAKVQDFYSADRTIVSKELAAYYGLPVPATDWAAVTYDSQRRGLIAQGSIHASYANSMEASPIKRGVFVRNRLLCQELPPPPANVDTTIPPPTPGLTMRERLARHLSQGQQSDGSNSCASCHQYIDKVGFAFENFDEAGLFRAFYAEKPGQAIDVSGEIKSPELLSDPSALSFQNFREMSDLLGNSQRTKECFAIQYLRYARGYVEQSEDQCLQQSLSEKLQKDLSVRGAFVELVSSDSFVWRK